MAIFERIFRAAAGSFSPVASPFQPSHWAGDFWGGSRTDAGVAVTEHTALGLTAVYAAINAISQDLSSLPLLTYERSTDGSLSEAIANPVYDLLKTAPNEYSTSSTFRGALIACCLGWGNGYALINRTASAKPVSLTLLAPDKTCPVRINGKLGYATTQTADGSSALLDVNQVIHLTLFTLDGIVGVSALTKCRQGVGIALAAERYSALYYSQAATPTGVLSHPGVLKDEAFRRLKDDVDAWASGTRAHKPLVLEEGMTWSQLSPVSPEDSQLISSRQLSTREIASLFRIPLQLLADSTGVNNSTAQQLALAYITYCLKPIAVRLEEQIHAKLLPTNSNLVVEHDFRALARGDMEQQGEYISLLRNSGAYSVNDIRRDLRMNPLPASEGADLRLAPVNYQPLSRLMDPNYVPPAPKEPPNDEIEK